jgi:uncharacterized membrane protein (UPF0182 family)
VAAVIGGFWGWTNWTTLRKWWYAVPGDAPSPLSNAGDVFYVYQLPLYEDIAKLIVLLALVIVFAAAIWAFAPRPMERAHTHQLEVRFTRRYADYRPVYFALAGFALAVAGAQSLAVFRTAHALRGVASGTGWTDVRVLALTAAAAATAVAGVQLPTRPFTAWWHRRLAGNALHGPAPALRPVALPAVFIAIVWSLAALSKGRADAGRVLVDI